jgi:hypothetical protein
MINSGLYGDMSMLQDYPIANNAGQILLFQMLMFWAMLIMLNLLIGPFQNDKHQLLSSNAC